MNREEPGLPAEPCIAVVGCGYWGKNLLRNFAQIGQLYGFYDGDPARVQSFAAQYPQARGFAAYTAVLEDPRVRGVVLATPAQEHHAMAAAALRAGKDVFVEKPLALNVEEGSDLVDIARSAGRILMVGHLLQYHPAVQKMLELLGSGVLGKSSTPIPT